jgi:hypothetical protein
VRKSLAVLDGWHYYVSSDVMIFIDELMGKQHFWVLAFFAQEDRQKGSLLRPVARRECIDVK